MFYLIFVCLFLSICFLFFLLSAIEKNSKWKNVYFDTDGFLVQEKIDGKLEFLYSNFLGKVARYFFRTKAAATGYAWLQNSSWSKRKIDPFISKHKIKIADFVIPVGGFKSFNDFFTRKLKPGVRIVDENPNIVVSPADSKVLAFQNITDDVCFFIKSSTFNLSLLIGDRKLASEYKNGTLFLFRLAPHDYHRYHFPFDSVPLRHKMIHGRYESVNPITYKVGLLPLHENERHLIILKTREFGDVLFVTVGAMLVGKIIETYTPNQLYSKSAEMGYFAFGGSSIVMIFKKGIVCPNDLLLEHSKQDIETAVKMGQKVASVSID